MFSFGSKKTANNTTDRLWQLLGDHGIFMLTTHAVDRKTVRSRPMAGYPSQQERRVWFLTNEKGIKDEEIADNENVCVTLADTSKQHFVSLSGRASIRDDVERKRQLWSVAAQAWFPEGPDDPAVLLLCVELNEAEFWDGDPNPVLVSLKMAQAAATGEAMDAGENEKVNLRQASPEGAQDLSHTDRYAPRDFSFAAGPHYYG